MNSNAFSRHRSLFYCREFSFAGIIEKLSTTLRLDNATSHSDQESSAEEQETSVRLIDRSFIKILSNRVR